ncbi:hypothetical protein NM208_g2714 [Fusarium decemcellulare]|uniref:Uncharacterized protein n=1 Tax=Fusarium decemcellulare TaxID=57161 RepID=A0ACC1SRN1_9HYPO|nr:hypothetical protein NM208_g2714 [Fusarium decemcellulare]
MSGLEPLAALGLACNIMQLLTFGREAISLCRKIDHEGSSDPSLKTYSEKAGNVSEDLKKHLSLTGSNLAPEDAELAETAKNCKDAADELSNLLQSLSMNGKSSRREKLITTGKTILKKSRIMQLENNLNNIKSNLDTQLLVKIFNRLNPESLRGDMMADVEKLLGATLKQVSLSQDLTQQHLDGLQKAQERFYYYHLESFKVIEQYMAGTTLYFEDERRRRQEEEDRFCRQRLLDSLHFESINQRKNEIYEAYDTRCWVFKKDGKARYWISEKDDDTCCRIWEPGEEADRSGGIHSSDSTNLDPPPKKSGYSQRTWPSFVDWLGSEKELIYWICGKPGSGKSTLMKFIASEKSPTKQYLKKWKQNAQIFSHFFWLAGSEMQHSLKGFLCSLVHQILSRDESAALRCFRSNTSKLHHTDWSPAELESLLIDLTRRDGKAYFIVIDGLDEVSPKDTQNALIQLIKKLEHPQVKFCLSSRSEGVLKTLERYPTLPMHEFIKEDIKKYTQKTLQKANPGGYNAVALKDFTNTVVENADGVFLWVYLVVNSLVQGFHNGDSEEVLFERLQDTPKDLTALYLDMLKRCKADPKSYKKGLSRVINTMLCATDFEWDRPEGSRRLECLEYDRISVFELMATTNEQFLEQYLHQNRKDIPLEHVNKLCGGMQKSVEAWSSGLLKVAAEEEYQRRFPNSVTFADKTVRFIHRTARDFLFNEEKGLGLWTADGFSQCSLRMNLVKACIVRCQIWTSGSHDSARDFLKSTYHEESCIEADQRSVLSAIGTAIGRKVLRDFLMDKPGKVQFLNMAGFYGFHDYVIGRVDEMNKARQFWEEHRRWLMFRQCSIAAFDASKFSIIDRWSAKERLIQYCAGLQTRIPPVNQLQPRPNISTICVFKYLVSTLELLNQNEFVNDLDYRSISEQIVKTVGMLEQDQASIHQDSQTLVELTLFWRSSIGELSGNFHITNQRTNENHIKVSLVFRVNGPYLARAIFEYLHSDILIPKSDIEATQPHAEALLLTVHDKDEVIYEILAEDSKLVTDTVSPMLLERSRLKHDLDKQARKLGSVLEEIMSKLPQLYGKQGWNDQVIREFISDKVTELVSPRLLDCPNRSRIPRSRTNRYIGRRA